MIREPSPATQSILPVSKVIKRPQPKQFIRSKIKPQHKPEPEIVVKNISQPETVTRKGCHRKYQVRLEYVNKGDTQAKLHRKVIMFGDQNQQDYVDNQDPKTKQLVMARLRKYHSPLQPNFYRYHLLNSEASIKEAYLKLLSSI